MFEKFEKSKIIFWMLNMGAAIVFFFMNCCTPLHDDDYPYRFSFATGERIKSLGDVIESQKVHYVGRGGRVIGHGIDQLLLTQDKMLFNILNTVVFVLFVLVVYFLARRRTVSNSALILEYVAIWFFMPRGNCLLWQTVACNYFWGTFFIVLFLLPYVVSYEERRNIFGSKWGSRVATVVFFPIGIWSGEFLEAGDAMLLAGIVVFLVLQFCGEKEIYGWQWTGLLGALIGYAILILAPGNFARTDAVNSALGEQNLLYSLVYRIARETYYLIIHMWWLILAVVILLAVAKRGKTWRAFAKGNVVAVCFAGLSILGVYVMTATAAYAERVLVTPVAFMIVAGGCLLKCVQSEIKKDVLCCITFFCFVYMLTTMSAALYKTMDAKYILDYRVEYVSPSIIPKGYMENE